MNSSTTNSFWNWEFPSHWKRIKTIDMHTEGEPLRIIVSGLDEIKGKTILEKRRYFQSHYDNIRKSLMFEPRGHADMYGAILTEACSPKADFGVFFMHNEGYSTMCGHAIIALTKMAFDTGMVEKKGEHPELEIDTPAGLIRTHAVRKNGKITKTSFTNVPSFVSHINKSVGVEGLGNVNFDIAFGGAFYAFCQAEDFGLQLIPEEYDRIIDYGKRIKQAIIENFEIKHPFEKDLSFLYGVIFIGPADRPENHSRNVCVFANGEVDRSPTGSGVSARAALHFFKNEMDTEDVFTIESILGTTMDVEIEHITDFGPYAAIVPKISGTSHFTGRNEFFIDPDDPLINGFIFR